MLDVKKKLLMTQSRTNHCIKVIVQRGASKKISEKKNEKLGKKGLKIS